ncbi:MAG: hypothetical protein R2880_11690 [Deinococcales bacterium]
MKRFSSLFILLLSLFFSQALAQVSEAEILGVETTTAASSMEAAQVFDKSVGEATVNILAKDADGNPVAEADVLWSVKNSTDGMVYVVAINGEAAHLGVLGKATLIVSAKTNAEGKASLTLDMASAGDASVSVTVGDVSAKGYDGRDMRVVWF